MGTRGSKKDTYGETFSRKAREDTCVVALGLTWPRCGAGPAIE